MAAMSRLVAWIAVACAVGCGDRQRPVASVDVDGGVDLDDFEGEPDPAWAPSEPVVAPFDFPPWVNAPAQDRIVVSWRTLEETTGAVFARGPDGDVHVASSGSAGLVHHAELTGLAAGARYEYEVFVDGSSVTRRGQFVTPGRDVWRFVHLAEFHAPTESEEVARFTEWIRRFRPQVVVESGDMVDNGNNLEHWRSYMRTSAPWISNVILLPAHSNHVNGVLGNAQLVDLFELPNNERWYVSRFGDVEIFTLDSTYNGSNPDVPFAQLDWIAGAATPGSFRIGAWHYPGCSTAYASRASQHEWVLANLVDAFDEAGGIDLVLVGHDKYYERSLIDGKVTHVMTAAGRLAPSTMGLNPERCEAIHSRYDILSIGMYEVRPDEVQAVVIEQNGILIDAFTLPRR